MLTAPDVPMLLVRVVHVIASVEVRILPFSPPATHMLLPYAIERTRVAPMFDVRVVQVIASVAVYKLEPAPPITHVPFAYVMAYISAFMSGVRNADCVVHVMVSVDLSNNEL